MKAMLSAFAAIAIIAVGANQILIRTGFSSQDQTASASVRLD
ncbi:hypothetical protein [Yoonia sediminilitoris]|uniref:Uncharacterized protein n=1 Tax=Yoonia sediminilitoris TaxID=1286148 RepID=A0A2T6K9M5_9RHOB|nr:hypothetical protein [Yoonia sediminilitoris]PUB11506.1 hypothetical protein C8N45_11323 [Yoonia sediminilitoris]RCW91706.1 hypothetical protein DFP92_11323 [Yoonia sediminilitoris]